MITGLAALPHPNPGFTEQKNGASKYSTELDNSFSGSEEGGVVSHELTAITNRIRNEKNEMSFMKFCSFTETTQIYEFEIY